MTGHFEMEITFPGGYRVNADFKDHSIRTDQPKEEGGEDSAPTPFDLFLASIGTCLGVYVLDFCLERKIPTAGLKLIQRMQKNPEKRMVEKISIEVVLPKEFPEKYKGAIIRGLNLCTVKKHLENPPDFEVSVTILKN